MGGLRCLVEWRMRIQNMYLDRLRRFGTAKTLILVSSIDRYVIPPSNEAPVFTEEHEVAAKTQTGPRMNIFIRKKGKWIRIVGRSMAEAWPKPEQH